MATQVAFTAEQLARMPEDGNRHEIDRGELLTMTLPNRRHGRLQMRLGFLLSKFLEGKNLGELISESGFILARNPDTLRGPDLAFVRQERLEGLAQNAWIPVLLISPLKSSHPPTPCLRWIARSSNISTPAHTPCGL